MATSMVELAFNGLMLVVTAGGVAVAWASAVVAGRRQADAKRSSVEAAEAQRLAVRAQEAAARALDEANSIAVDAIGRADEANLTAQSALDLQARIDAREREFRDVRWDGRYHLDDQRRVAFRLTNTGLTPAREVTLVLSTMGRREKTYALGDVEPLESADAVIGPDPANQAAIELMLFSDDPWRVHWSSPLGQVQEFSYAGRQVF